MKKSLGTPEFGDVKVRHIHKDIQRDLHKKKKNSIKFKKLLYFLAGHDVSDLLGRCVSSIFSFLWTEGSHRPGYGRVESVVGFSFSRHDRYCTLVWYLQYS